MSQNLSLPLFLSSRFVRNGNDKRVVLSEEAAAAAKRASSSPLGRGPQLARLHQLHKEQAELHNLLNIVTVLIAFELGHHVGH